MSKSKAANHLHRYRRVNLGRDGKEYLVYRCTKPLCTHYIRLDMAEGTMCECNRCGSPMIINREVMTKSSGRPMAKPHCLACTKSKKPNLDAIAEFLKEPNV